VEAISNQLNTGHPGVKLKLDLLEAATPVPRAVVYGDMWRVEGAYTLRCVELGCAGATLIDLFETPNWQRTRIEHPELEFLKGDFADALFMGSVRTKYDLGVAYDVLLHLSRRPSRAQSVTSTARPHACFLGFRSAAHRPGYSRGCGRRHTPYSSLPTGRE
jgi:hypothetical protein